MNTHGPRAASTMSVARPDSGPALRALTYRREPSGEHAVGHLRAPLPANCRNGATSILLPRARRTARLVYDAEPAQSWTGAAALSLGRASDTVAARRNEQSPDP
jgi:hypothetical protein